MPRIEPKKTFLENKDVARWLEGVVDSSMWQAAASFALAEYATHRPSAEELRGAVSFLALLSGLADQTEKPVRDPGYNLKRQQTQPSKPEST